MIQPDITIKDEGDFAMMTYQSKAGEQYMRGLWESPHDWHHSALGTYEFVAIDGDAQRRCAAAAEQAGLVVHLV